MRTSRTEVSQYPAAHHFVADSIVLALREVGATGLICVLVFAMREASPLLNQIRSALQGCAGLRLCVAYSGGLDSTVLLHLLARLAPETGFFLSAIHVHHGLSAQADAWAEHCATECAALGIGLSVERVLVVRDAGKGVEAAARDARHAVFARVSADWIVLAHHADDQAETLLHRLTRGAGVAGAAGMRERDAVRRLWRPLLAVPRADLEVWARAEALSWVEDDSNPEQRFTRNFLRHSVLRPLAERFPAAPRNLARAAGLFAEADDLLEDLARIDEASVLLGLEGARAALRDLGAPRARNLLRYWLGRRGELAVDAVRMDDLLLRLLGAGPVREQLGRTCFCAYQERIWLESAPESCYPIKRAWLGESELPWFGGGVRFREVRGEGGARLNLQKGELELRVRQGGERMRLSMSRPQRDFKTLCQEAQLPPWWRPLLPMLWQGDDLVWIGGVGVAASARCVAGEPGWRIEWCAPEGVWR